MNTPIAEEALVGIRAALFQGRKIEAIKLYRSATAIGLAEAKAAVEKLETELRTTSPEKFAVPAIDTDRRGCLGVLVILCLVAAVFLWWLHAA